MTQAAPALAATAHRAQDIACLDAALREFDRFLDPASVRVALDAGSRDGFIASELARHYPEAQVTAFECNPDAIAICHQQLEGIPRVSLVPQAVAGHCGTVTFFPIDPARTVTPHKDGNIGASSLFRASTEYPHEKYAQTKITVPCTTLANWAKETGTEDVDILWMDLQGGELQALEGLGDLLGRVKLLYTEVEYKPMYVGAPLFDEVDTFLRSRGFELVQRFNTSEWFGDALYVRRDLMRTNPSPAAVTAPSVHTRKTLVIQVRHGGLGDHLFWSHLPRIAKQSARFERVVVSTFSEFRQEAYKRFIWENNPFVDGFCDENPNYEDVADVQPGRNLLDEIMLLLGLDDGVRFHEPELYFRPKIQPALANSVVYDPNYLSFVGDISVHNIQTLLNKENLRVDFQMKLWGKSYPMPSPKIFLETPHFEDYCSVIASCRQFICLASGGATLAAALSTPALVLHGGDQKRMFHHSKHHRYQVV